MGDVQNHEMLEEIFGYWPSFHDAEVVRMRLDRGDSTHPGGERRKPSLETDVHVFEITDQVTDQGFYALRKHTLATLAFHGIDDLQLEGFNHQNVLFGLQLEDVSQRQLEALKWQVSFDSSFGVHSTLMCETIEVVRAVPYEPPARMAGTQLPPSPAPDDA
jgi:hypothetical protein